MYYNYIQKIFIILFTCLISCYSPQPYSNLSKGTTCLTPEEEYREATDTYNRAIQDLNTATLSHSMPTYYGSSKKQKVLGLFDKTSKNYNLQDARNRVEIARQRLELAKMRLNSQNNFTNTYSADLNFKNQNEYIGICPYCQKENKWYGQEKKIRCWNCQKIFKMEYN